MRYAILALILTACGASTGGVRPSQGTISESTQTPREWEFSNYELCELNLNPSLESLPFEIATTLNRVDLPFGRFDGYSSARPHLIQKDLSINEIGSALVEIQGQTGVSFDGEWNSDDYVYLTRRWQRPEAAMLEEVLKTILMSAENYRVDIVRFDVRTNEYLNLTSDSVGFYNNSPANFGSKIAFTSVVNGEGRPFSMNKDGTEKQTISAGAGYAYGITGSPDGSTYAYNSNYKVFVGENQIQTPCEFNFMPTWSPNSQKIAFWCGKDDIYIANRDGSGIKKVGARNGYSGIVKLIDGYDFHGGASDYFAWADSENLIYAAQKGNGVELFKVNVETLETEQLTDTGAQNYFPDVRGDHLLFHSDRTGSRDLFTKDLRTGVETQITSLKKECGARQAKWKKN